jgi:hypothetical protein
MSTHGNGNGLVDDFGNSEVLSVGVYISISISLKSLEVRPIFGNKAL